MNISGAETGEVVFQALRSLEMRKKGQGKGEERTKWGLIMKETELGGMKRWKDD